MVALLSTISAVETMNTPGSEKVSHSPSLNKLARLTIKPLVQPPNNMMELAINSNTMNFRGRTFLSGSFFIAITILYNFIDHQHQLNDRKINKRSKHKHAGMRSDKRRVGKKCVGTCKY